jgi:hypothetical protein
MTWHADADVVADIICPLIRTRLEVFEARIDLLQRNPAHSAAVQQLGRV